jgi:glycosyltransferase involved in cell wall biosynthesis
LQEAHRLLYVGQLIERKGLIPFVSELVRWLEFHPTNKVELTLAGEGPVREQLEDLPLPNNLVISFLGKINYSDLPPCYAKAGIFVFPTLGDEWGLVVNEAMMTGLPVLGSIYSQAVEELVEDGLNGWTFTPDAPPSLHRALDVIMTTSDAHLEEMRIQARRTASKLTPEYAAQQFAASLTAVVKS